MTEEIAYLHALGAFRPWVSAHRLHQLLAVATSPRAAWGVPDEQLAHLGWPEETRQHFTDHRSQWPVADAYPRLQHEGVVLIPETDVRYPSLLRTLFDPPIVLYVRGDLRGEDTAIAVVGSRRATPYGKTATNILVRPLAARGLTIVSGLAYGIDAEAHRATLAVHGRTVAVLGSGVDDASLYPRAHRSLAHDILTAGGAVVSEYPPGTRPQGYFFPQRNRVIAGMSRAVVVVEADEKSGALITAREGLEQNRDVFAVPGPITAPTSAGTNRLLRDGAAPARSAEDILDALALQQTLPAAPAPAHQSTEDAGEFAIILPHLHGDPRSIDDLSKVSTLPPNVVASLLTMLELDGRVRDVGGKQYVRV